jgi:hypothetical protein
MKTLTEACKPREDVLSGRLPDSIYVADLTRVRDSAAPSVYQDPSEFFRNTYPTEGLKTTIREVFSRLAGQEGSPVIKLETSLGGGKTHSLIALYHIAQGGSTTPGASEYTAGMSFPSVRTAIIVGSELGVARRPGEPLTVWGHLAKELRGNEGYELVRAADEQMSSPGERTIRELLGNDRSLILIDEMALYLAKAATVTVGDSDLARQTAVFLQELSNVASSLSNVVVVITSLDKESVFREGTELMTSYLNDEAKITRGKDAISDAEKVLSRVVRTLTPTKGEEFSAVVLRRLFESIDPTAREEVCRAYMSMLSSDSNVDYLPSHARSHTYLKNLESSYPFHPELINILRTKTSSIPNFNKTRGVLRLLSKVLRSVWNGKRDVYLIHPYAVDMRRQELVEEIVSKLDRGELQAAIAADISNETDAPRASKVDQLYSEPLGTMICNVIFLHSITGARVSDTTFGVSEPEIHLSLARPGFDLKKSEDALKALERNCFYLVQQGTNYAFTSEPNLNKLIEATKESVEQTRVYAEIYDRVRSMFSSKRFFSPVFFANQPSEVSDDTEKPKLVIMDFRDCSMKAKGSKWPAEVTNIYEKAGSVGSPRIFINNVVFLLADEEETSIMADRARNTLALTQLVKDSNAGAPYLASLSRKNKDDLATMKKESELYFKIAVMTCHRHLLVPTEQSSLFAPGQRPLRHLIMRVSDSEARNNVESRKNMEDVVVEFLRVNSAARTADDNPLSPEFVFDELWDRKRESYSADEFRKMFYKRPTCGLILTDELIRGTLKSGLESGKWVAVAGDELYDKTNSAMFYSPLDNNAEIVLSGTEKYRGLIDHFYCRECKKRSKQCICTKVEENEVSETETEKKCPQCGQSPSDCICHSDRSIKIDSKKLERVAADLLELAREQSVDRFRTVVIKAESRDALVKLLYALPQFGKVDMRFDLKFNINQKPDGGNYLDMKYEGDRAGVEAIRSILTNYESKHQMSQRSLNMMLDYPEGVPVEEFCDLLGEKVKNYTMEAPFTVTALPHEGEQ